MDRRSARAAPSRRIFPSAQRAASSRSRGGARRVRSSPSMRKPRRRAATGARRLDGALWKTERARSLDGFGLDCFWFGGDAAELELLRAAAFEEHFVAEADIQHALDGARLDLTEVRRDAGVAALQAFGGVHDADIAGFHFLRA